MTSLYPDKKLKEISKEVTSFDTDLHEFLDNMYETMLESNGIGLAAIQVAVAKRILVLCIPDEEGEQSKDKLLEIINPVVSNETGIIVYQEGCLSVPGVNENVVRPNYVKVKALNEKGEEFILEGEELLARAVCHENEHLDGILFIDHLD